MKLITVHLPEVYLAALNDLVRRGHFPNRSEAIRVAIRDMIKEESSTFDFQPFDFQPLKKKLKPLKELIRR